MYRILALFSCLAAAGLAQTMPGPILFAPSFGFPTALKNYLGLTSQQVESLVNANTDYTRYQAPRLTRMAQVQLEIAQETAKSPLDPMALGLRYAEVEAIRRELAEQLDKTRQTLLGALTDAQKAKLKALEEALKLQALIVEAQCENLLAPATGQPATLVPVTGVTGFTSVITGRVAIGIGCTRNGDFLPAPVQP
jgi:hypothetical protein